MESKRIAITGNMGKTIFSFYLGQILSFEKKRVVLVSTDDLYPTYSTLFPQKRKYEDSQKSLGKLLSLPLIVQTDIFLHGRIINDNFIMISYNEHESSLNYPKILETAIHNMFAELEKVADIVLIDTSSCQNKIDRYIENSEVPKISITSTDAKGFHYRDLHPKGRWNLYLQTNKYNAIQDIKSSFQMSENAMLLPFSKSLQSIYNGLDITDVEPNSQYRKVLLQIAGEL